MLSETNFSPFFQFLHQKLSSSEVQPDPQLLSQAKKFIEDSANLSDKLLSKSLYSDSEEILINAIKIQQSLTLLSPSKDRLFSLFHKLAILYKLTKSPKKGYKKLTEFLNSIENVGIKQKKEFSLSGIEKIYIILSEFCLELTKYKEARGYLEKALEYLRILFEAPKLLLEFKYLISNNEKYEEKIRKKRLELAHARALLSKSYRKEGDYDKAYENLEISLQGLIGITGENSEIVKKFKRKLMELDKKREFFKRLETFEEEEKVKKKDFIEENDESSLNNNNEISNNDNLRKTLVSENINNRRQSYIKKPENLFLEKNRPKSKRKLTIPKIKIMDSQTEIKPFDNKEKEPKETLTSRASGPENPYFLNKGFNNNIQTVHKNKQKGSSFIKGKYPSFYISFQKNPLSKSTAYTYTNSNNYLNPSTFNSTSRSHLEIQAKNPRKAGFISKLSEIITGKKSILKPSNSLIQENSLNNFFTDREKVQKMKKSYLLTNRPKLSFSNKESSERNSLLMNSSNHPERTSINEKPNKVVIIERISHKNLPIIENNLTFPTLQLNENQTKSPLVTPTHRVSPSPLDSFSKKVNNRKSENFNSVTRKNPENKKSHSYKTAKKPMSSLQKRRKTMAFTRKSLVKSPSLENLSKNLENVRKDSGTNIFLKSESCFSENSPFLTVDRREKQERKFTWESKDFGNLSVLSRNRDLETLDLLETNTNNNVISRNKSAKGPNLLIIQKKPHILIILRRKMAANKIHKALRNWLYYRKYNVIFNRRIPMNDLIQNLNKNSEKPLVEKLKERFQSNIDLTDFPKTPKHLFEKNKDFYENLKQNPNAFNALTGLIRKNFPWKWFNVRFFHKGNAIILKDWKIEQIKRSSMDFLIKMRFSLECKDGIFLIEKEVGTIGIKDEFFYYLYIWPLVNELMTIYLIDKGIFIENININFANKGFIYKENIEKMSLDEENALHMLIEKFLYLLDKHLVVFRKIIGSELRLFPNSDYKFGILNMFDFLEKRHEVIRKSACQFEVISPFLLSYLGYEKQLPYQGIVPNKRLHMKKAWSFGDCKYARYIANFLEKKSFDNYQGLSSISSNISPKSVRRSITNRDFEISMRKCDEFRDLIRTFSQETPISRISRTERKTGNRSYTIKIPDFMKKSSIEAKMLLEPFIEEKKSPVFSRKEIEEEILINELSFQSNKKIERNSLTKLPILDLNNKNKSLHEKKPPSINKKIKKPQISFEKMSSETNLNRKQPRTSLIEFGKQNSEAFIDRKTPYFGNPIIENSSKNRIRGNSGFSGGNNKKENHGLINENHNYVLTITSSSKKSSKKDLGSNNLELSSQEDGFLNEEKFIEELINKKDCFPSYIFQEKPMISNKFEIFEGNFLPFYKDILLYSQIIRKNRMFFIQTIRLDFPLENRKMPDNLEFYIEFFMIKQWQKDYKVEKLRFSLEKFESFFFSNDLFDIRQFIYRKGFNSIEKRKIKALSEKSFEFENATFCLKPENQQINNNFLHKKPNFPIETSIFSSSQLEKSNFPDIPIEKSALLPRNWLIVNNLNELRIMKFHNNTIFLRSSKYYIRFLGNKHYRFEFSNDFSSLRLSAYEPFFKKSHYSLINSQEFIEKIVIILQQQGSIMLREKLLRNILIFQRTLIGQKLLISREKTMRKSSIFFIQKLQKEILFYYTKIITYYEKDLMFSMVIELKPANSKTKLMRIAIKPKDFIELLDINPESLCENQIKSEILNRISLKRGFLYKTPIINMKKGLFLKYKPHGKNLRLLKCEIATFNVIFQKIRKFNGFFTIITIIKQEKLEFWNLIVDFPLVSRRFLTNFYKSDILKLKEECLSGLFNEDLEELKEKTAFLFNRRKGHNFHEFNEVFINKDIFKSKKSLNKLEEKTSFSSLKDINKEIKRKINFFDKKSKKSKKPKSSIEILKSKTKKSPKFQKQNNKEFLAFCEMKFWDQLIEKMDLVINKQNKFLLKIDTFHGILREIIGSGTINDVHAETSRYFECFLEKTPSKLLQKPMKLAEVLDLNLNDNLRNFSIYLRITDLERKDCRNFKFPLEYLGKLYLTEKYKAKDLKILKKKLKNYIKTNIPEENLTKVSHSLKIAANVYKLNGDFHDYRLNSLKNPDIILLFRGVFSLRPRKILAIFLNKKKRKVLFFLFDNAEAKDLINAVKLHDLKRVFPFVKEMVSQGLMQELGGRIFKFFKNQLFFHNICYKRANIEK